MSAATHRVVALPGDGAVVRDSILLGDSEVAPQAIVERAIDLADEDVAIGAGPFR